MCHPCKEGDNHAKRLATSSADKGTILARFWNVVGEEEKEGECERREDRSLHLHILSFLHIHIPRLFVRVLLLILPFSLGLYSRFPCGHSFVSNSETGRAGNLLCSTIRVCPKAW